MLDKIFNKKKKEEDIFTVPQRKNPPDLKSIPKLGPKALQQTVVEEQKYISVLVSKIEQIKAQHQKLYDKSQQLKQKNQVINGQVLKMSNQHQQLTIKFDNLQNSLQLMISTSQQHLSSQLQFIKSTSSLSPTQPIPRTLQQVFSLYQDRFSLCSKISQQNRCLKQKITQIELRFEEIRQRYQQAEKQKGYNSLIPELMVSLEELKKERRDLTEGKKLVQVENQQVKKNENVVKKDQGTMTSEKMIPQSRASQQQSSNKNIPFSQCLQCKQSNNQITLLKQIQSTLMQQVGQWSSKCQTLSMSFQQSNEHLKTLIKDKQSKQRSIKQLNEDIHKLNKENEGYMKEVGELKDTLSKFEEILDKMKQENGRLRVDVETVTIKLSMKDHQLTALNMRLSTLMVKEQEQSQQQGNQIDSQQTSCLTKTYQQQIKPLQQQHQITLNQLTLLKHQHLTQSSQLTRLSEFSESLSKTQVQLSKTRQSLTQSLQITNSIEQKYKQLMAENQQELMNKIKSLQVKRGQNQKQLVYLRNYKVNSEQDMKKMLATKKVLQEQLKQLQLYKSDVQSRILPTLRSDLQTTKKQLQRISQQKQIIQQNSLQNINQLNNNYQFLLTQKQSWTKQKAQLQLKINQLLKQSSSKKLQIQTFSQMIQNLNHQMTDKMLQIQKLSDDYKTKSHQTQELYQQLRSKQRKYQSQLNQQRIRLQTMKRTISVQQTKLQQNQKSSNKFYDQSMHKDKKITYMQVKLKEYKHLIQSLKKEKQQVQKTYLERLKGYEETITEVVSEEQDTERKTNKDEQTNNNRDAKLKQGRQQNETFTTDKDTDYFKNQLLSYQQSNLVLTQQNTSLRQQIKQLHQQLHDRKKQVQHLQQKRQQTLKQIQKLNLRSINGSLQPPSSQFLQKQKQYLKQRQQFQAYKQKTQQRMKKIALKAYKGFDILLKRHHSLYKEFMAVFVKEIADRQQVKNIESEINMLVNKSTDMKDVFQDYI